MDERKKKIPEIEKKTAIEIKEFQEEKLREMLRYINEKSPFYRNLFTGENIDISTIEKLEDLHQIPVTSKEDLQKRNDDFFCVERREIIDYVTTSGTLGDPVTIALTEADLERLAYNEAISLECCGITKDDVIQLMTTMDRRFMAGLAYFLGARKIGAGIVRVGSGVPELQWDSIKKFKPTYLIAVPSFLLKLIEYAKQHNLDISQTGVKAAICIGESIREQDFSLNMLGKKITENWNIELFSTYASTEMGTAFNECENHTGCHHHPELIIVEILDENNRQVKNGEVGELTITTLGMEATPLLRFKTGDLVKFHTEACSCGRNTLRLGPVVGRKKQMIKYKGTTLYPSAIFNVLNDFSKIENYIVEIYHNEFGTDEILIKIASKNISEEFLSEIKDHFRAKLRVAPRIQSASFEELEKVIMQPLGRKPIQIFDRR
ncbi:phenylacetate--CoA ligase family protein [Aequorivita echinoideorum]|uniref:AMP-binding protein n=1 Tax=Aequorivita echinoideorum TaxID=1549647 RepID=A0ABS5S7A0_9FLAO|nr:AMP-binding protein [Aequorivita echinoideorum]MBT0607735.1 AMP-binding protein [Aequorivita echinoideorum]